MDLGLKGKTALITGGSKGIGRAVAQALAGEGVRPLICARDEAALGHAAADIKRATGQEVLTCAADLGGLEGVTRVAKEAISRFNRLDILVNNAGAIKRGDFLAMPDDEWVQGWNVKLLGYVRMAREILPHMQQQGGGRIVNVIGAAARNPSAMFMIGGTANAALVNFTKVLADLGAKSNVLVTGVSPALVRTERFDALTQQQAAATGRDLESVAREQFAEYPLGRIAKPEEVADLVCFLASERASFLTGVTITLDGGSTRGVYL